MLIITWPVVVSNLYNLKPGLLGPPGVVGDMLGAIIIQDTGRPDGTNLFCHVFTSHVRAARRWKDVRGRGRGARRTVGGRRKPRNDVKTGGKYFWPAGTTENLSIRSWPRPFPIKERGEKYEWSVTEWTCTAS